MSYNASLASVPLSEIERARAADPDTVIDLDASLVIECPHDLTNVDLQPLGAVLQAAIDLGQPLRNDGWHPLRAPIVVDPETVMIRSRRLQEAWHIAKPELGGMMAEMLGPGIDGVLALYAHATSRGESVVSVLSAPDDPDRAAKTLLPHLHSPADQPNR